MPLTTTATWPTLTNRTASAADVNSKFNWLEGHRYPMNGGALTTGAFDIGSSAYKWKTAHFNSNVIVDSVTVTSDTIGGKIGAWGKMSVSGNTLTADGSFNVASIISITGEYIINYATYFTGPLNPPGIATVRHVDARRMGIDSGQVSVTVQTRNLAGTLLDQDFNFIIGGY